jgi:hypothetical protein
MASLAMRASASPWPGEILDRRVRQRNHLAVIAERVHLGKARVEIVNLAHAAQPGGDVAELWRNFVHLVEEASRRDVAVKVDECPVGHGNLPQSHLSPPRGERSSERSERG